MTGKTPRILVVRGGAIGDFILTLPAMGALRERWPDAHVEILGYPHIMELARERFYADATRSIEARSLAGFFVPDGELDPSLVDYFAGFNLVVSYLYDPDSIFANNVRRCGVRQLIEASPAAGRPPAAKHYCKPLEALAIFVPDPRPRVFPSETDRVAASRWLSLARRKGIAAIHPGSGSERKNWPAEKFAALGRWLCDELDFQLLIVEGEADDQAVKGLQPLLEPRPWIMARGLKLVELAAVLERCALYLGNDSGITHLAAAVGTPTVAMFGPVSPAIWEPGGERVRVVRFGTQDVAVARQAIEALVIPRP